MRRIVLGIMIALVLLCVVGLGGGYLLIRRSLGNADEAFVEVIATELHTSASEVIAHAPANPTTIHFAENELTVNNAELPGEAGFETGTDGTIVYGTTLEIDRGGLSLVMGGTVLYKGRP